MTEASRGVTSVYDEADKKAAMLMGKLMGLHAFAGLDQHASDQMISPRVQESTAWTAWEKNGKPNINYGGRLSELLRTAFLNGEWTLDAVNFQEASTLATVIKNTVNIMTAVDYAGANRWYDEIVDTIESDNPIDDITLAPIVWGR